MDESGLKTGGWAGQPKETKKTNGFLGAKNRGWMGQPKEKREN